MQIQNFSVQTLTVDIMITQSELTSHLHVRVEQVSLLDDFVCVEVQSMPNNDHKDH